MNGAKGVLIMAVLTGSWMTAVAVPGSAVDQVTEAERAFARSMADRDLQAFKEFLSEEAIFFAGPTPLRGKQQITDGWAPYFADEAAPFSWEPDQVEVLESGVLALSTGLVRDPAGKIIGRFNSIWRLEAPDVWRVVFDKGSPVCPESQEQGAD